MTKDEQILSGFLENTEPNYRNSIDADGTVGPVAPAKPRVMSHDEILHRFLAMEKTLVELSLDRKILVDALKEIAKTVPDDDVPNPGDEQEADKWRKIAIKRRILASDVLKELGTEMDEVSDRLELLSSMEILF